MKTVEFAQNILHTCRSNLIPFENAYCWCRTHVGGTWIDVEVHTNFPLAVQIIHFQHQNHAKSSFSRILKSVISDIMYLMGTSVLYFWLESGAWGGQPHI